MLVLNNGLERPVGQEADFSSAEGLKLAFSGFQQLNVGRGPDSESPYGLSLGAPFALPNRYERQFAWFGLVNAELVVTADQLVRDVYRDDSSLSAEQRQFILKAAEGGLSQQCLDYQRAYYAARNIPGRAPVFFRLDMITPDDCIESNIPGGGQGQVESMSQLMKFDGHLTGLAVGWAKAIRGLTGKESPKTWIRISSERKTRFVSYFVSRLRELGLDAHTYTTSELPHPDRVDYLQPPVFGAVGDSRGWDRIFSAYLDGQLVMEPAPSSIYISKVPEMLAFHPLTSGLFSPQVRDLYPKTHLVEDGLCLTGPTGTDGDLSVRDLHRYPDLCRRFVLKYAGGCFSKSGGSRGVHQLSGEEPVEDLLETAIQAWEEQGEPWLLQELVPNQHEVRFLEGDSLRTARLFTRMQPHMLYHSGSAELLAGNSIFSSDSKTHVTAETIVTPIDFRFDELPINKTPIELQDSNCIDGVCVYALSDGSNEVFKTSDVYCARSAAEVQEIANFEAEVDRRLRPADVRVIAGHRIQKITDGDGDHYALVYEDMRRWPTYFEATQPDRFEFVLNNLSELVKLQREAMESAAAQGVYSYDRNFHNWGFIQRPFTGLEVVMYDLGQSALHLGEPVEDVRRVGLASLSYSESLELLSFFSFHEHCKPAASIGGSAVVWELPADQFDSIRVISIPYQKTGRSNRYALHFQAISGGEVIADLPVSLTAMSKLTAVIHRPAFELALSAEVQADTANTLIAQVVSCFNLSRCFISADCFTGRAYLGRRGFSLSEFQPGLVLCGRMLNRAVTPTLFDWEGVPSKVFEASEVKNHSSPYEISQIGSSAELIADGALSFLKGLNESAAPLALEINEFEACCGDLRRALGSGQPFNANQFNDLLTHFKALYLWQFLPQLAQKGESLYDTGVRVVDLRMEMIDFLNLIAIQVMRLNQISGGLRVSPRSPNDDQTQQVAPMPELHLAARL